jgi:hypothetical protein
LYFEFAVQNEMILPEILVLVFVRLQTTLSVAAIAEAFNSRQAVSKRVSLLGDLQLKFEFCPTPVSNADKADIYTVPNQSSKIIF